MQENFQAALKERLCNMVEKDYESFEKIFPNLLNLHAPYKKKVVRATDKPYMTKTLRKAIMKHSSLENKYYKCISETNRRALKKQI